MSFTPSIQYMKVAGIEMAKLLLFLPFVINKNDSILQIDVGGMTSFWLLDVGGFNVYLLFYWRLLFFNF